MSGFLASISNTENQILTLVLFILAILRIYLEVIGFDFKKLPMTKFIARNRGNLEAMKLHKTGLYLSIGYVILFAPAIIFS
jgi:hypothetical protein